jgi:hypothetical protein
MKRKANRKKGKVTYLDRSPPATGPTSEASPHTASSSHLQPLDRGKLLAIEIWSVGVAEIYAAPLTPIKPTAAAAGKP